MTTDTTTNPITRYLGQPTTSSMTDQRPLPAADDFDAVEALLKGARAEALRDTPLDLAFEDIDDLLRIARDAALRFAAEQERIAREEREADERIARRQDALMADLPPFEQSVPFGRFGA